MLQRSDCALLFIAQPFLGQDSTDAQARIIQGVLTGIGFIGGGALLKKDNKVLGIAQQPAFGLQAHWALPLPIVGTILLFFCACLISLYCAGQHL
jgi:hypothetical protein